MTSELVVTNLARKGIRLWSEAGKLRWSGPEGAITATDLDILRRMKTSIMRALAKAPQKPIEQLLMSISDEEKKENLLFTFEERAGIYEYSDGYSRDEAEQMAIRDVKAEIERSA